MQLLALVGTLALPFVYRPSRLAHSARATHLIVHALQRPPRRREAARGGATVKWAGVRATRPRLDLTRRARVLLVCAPGGPELFYQMITAFNSLKTKSDTAVAHYPAPREPDPEGGGTRMERGGERRRKFPVRNHEILTQDTRCRERTYAHLPPCRSRKLRIVCLSLELAHLRA